MTGMGRGNRVEVGLYAREQKSMIKKEGGRGGLWKKRRRAQIRALKTTLKKKKIIRAGSKKFQ